MAYKKAYIIDHWPLHQCAHRGWPSTVIQRLHCVTNKTEACMGVFEFLSIVGRSLWRHPDSSTQHCTGARLV